MELKGECDILCGYEAGCLGFSLCHKLVKKGIRCVTLAPTTRMTQQGKRIKTHKHGLRVKLMLFCGLRTGETARVKICHFDFEKKLLFVDGIKTDNAQRMVPDEILQEVKTMNKKD